MLVRCCSNLRSHFFRVPGLAHVLSTALHQSRNLFHSRLRYLRSRWYGRYRLSQLQHCGHLTKELKFEVASSTVYVPGECSLAIKLVEIEKVSVKGRSAKKAESENPEVAFGGMKKARGIKIPIAGP